MTESLGCARCGDCCTDIWVVVAQAEITRYTAGSQVVAPTASGDRWAGRYQLDFFARYWRRIDQKMMSLADGTLVHKTRYSCAAYDAEHQRCTMHALRPQVCRDYPWYGQGPHAGKISNPRCSYLLDLPPDQRPENAYPLIPLEIL